MAKNFSYYPSYFSLSDILATQDRVPCKFEQTVYNLGFLDPSSGDKDIAVGTKLELPCWLARALSSSRRLIVSTQIPNNYREKYREILKADASVVDLHKLGPHFYEFGQHLLPLAGPEAPALANMLTQALRERLRGIMDSAQNTCEDEVTSQTVKLDELERTLFSAGQKALKDHKLWLSRRAHILTTSAMVEQHKKRKFNQCKSQIWTSSGHRQRIWIFLKTAPKMLTLVTYANIFPFLLLLFLSPGQSQNPVRVGQIRLAGGRGLHEGNIEIEVNGEWGFVCDDGFGFVEADLVCRSFGYEGAEKFTRNNHFGKNTKEYLRSPVKFWTSGAACARGFDSFRECVVSTVGLADCGSTEVAGVVCRTPFSQCPVGRFPCATSSACIQRQQVCDTLLNCPDNSDEASTLCDDLGVIRVVSNTRTNIPGAALGTVYVKHKSIWGTVCDDNLGSKDAQVICRSLGYGRGWALSFPSSYLGRGRGKIWVDSPSCRGNERWLGLCPGLLWGESSCGHHEDAGIFCYDGGLEARFVRVAGSQSAGTGRVEIKLGGVWGGVCSAAFDDYDAQVYCRMLGYNGDAIARRRTGKSAGPMWNINFDCLGYESSIQQCRVRFMNNTCAQDDTAGVICSEKAGRIDAELQALLPENCGQSEDASTQFLTSLAKVRGGTTPSRFDSPWLVSLRLRQKLGGRLVCGGAIISEYYVVTAAHCLSSAGKLNLVVRVGDYNSDVVGDAEEDFYIDKVWIHEAYNEMAFEDNDIALLKIEKKGRRGIIFGPQVRPLCLPSISESYRNLASCTFAGWGRLFKEGEAVSRPREATTEILPDSQCEGIFGGPHNYTSSMLCVGDPTQRVNPCSGDSGGPLVCKSNGRHTLYGLVSKGFNCDYFRAPDVFTRVAKHLRWMLVKLAVSQ
ncbi:DNA replication complex GINS protein PSF3 [Halocaridina rubra]|uniref:DNA replication complex GINS protein PSF3 n=1 Tax=Halocaridina rubra TaxID=373956 RepID=A0AAN8X5W1_HALRR